MTNSTSLPLEADMHCHSLASTHAYHTIAEMVSYAAKIGLKAFAVTDHGPAMPDSPHLWHFGGLSTLPDFMEGVRVYDGVEANIVDFDACLDIPEDVLRSLDWVIASFHEPSCPHGTKQQHTEAYLKLAENPYVDVIGHSAGENYVYDYEKVIPVFKKAGKLVEINKNQAAMENCKQIALLCKKYEVPVVVDSDAHNCFNLCNVQAAIDLLQSIDFPEQLIINRKLTRLEQWMKNRKRP